jgi:hypothetical protein
MQSSWRHECQYVLCYLQWNIYIRLNICNPNDDMW